jgi:2-polyprenyl-6-methoxyphenol hydroxylase-like FAD-dependent oxidoreductase
MEVGMLDVLVVGAGPAGLVTAIVLAERGVAVRVVDRAAGPVPESRAAILHVRTLELLDRLGVADRAVAEGLPIRTVEVFERGRLLGELPLSGRGVDDSRFPFALALTQDRTERLLTEHLSGLGVEIEHGTELVDLTITALGARAAVRGPGGNREEIVARWVVGADGAHSAVRHAAGIDLAGTTYAQTGLLADVRLDRHGRAAPGSDRIRLHLTAGGFVGVLPLAGGRHRLFGAVPPDLAEDARRPYAEVDPNRLQRWLDQRFGTGAQIGDVAWTALFRVHSRLAEQFRSGPVFLVGDAAHLHSPAGGQGLNLAVGDGVNLGWKLAAVATGEAPQELLASYPAERRPVARRVLLGTDRGFALETAAHPVAVWGRAHLAGRLLRPLLRLPIVRAAVVGLFAQTWIGYRDSPAVGGRAAGRRGPRPGDRLPDGRGSWPRDLRHRMLLVAGTAEAAGPALRESVRSLLDRYAGRVDVHHVPAAPWADRGAWLLLLRPDGHIGYAGPAADHTALSDHLDRTRLPTGR